MAIKFEDKKSGSDAGALKKPAKVDPTAERPKPVADAFPGPAGSAESVPQLPFAKPVRPEKKSRRK